LPNPLSETEQIVELQKKLVWAEMKIQVLEEQLRLKSRRRADANRYRRPRNRQAAANTPDGSNCPPVCRA
jgi:hypothetical protein